MSSSTNKRREKVTDDDLESISKKRKTTKRTSAKGSSAPDEWPEYFNDLYKVFKALNTVLAFITSRRNLAITFDVIRSSVEKILKHPLDLAKVAELKSLLPDLINFIYIPRHELLINEPAGEGSSTSSVQADSGEHVLILDFQDNWNGQSTKNLEAAGAFSLPTTRSIVSTKRLIDRRNKRFEQAVSELLSASGSTGDPVQLLQSAARAHVPVNPDHKEVEQEAFFPIPEPQQRRSIEAILTDLKEREWYHDQIIYDRIFEEKTGIHDMALDPPLTNTILSALTDSRGISSLYSHQVAAINALGKGKNVIVSTSTASGKSVIYQVPLLRFLEEDPSATAIFVYPTKALAQDQKGALQALIDACPGIGNMKVSTYDGDTPQDQRQGVRETASVILTNFDMIHASILPQEEAWRSFLKRVKLFVVDELHYYSGLFGSHVAYILRRFRRLCAAVGNRKLCFISCSATISKPLEHMTNMFGLSEESIEVVTEDGAPRGERHFAVWQPPSMDPEAPQFGNRTPVSEAVQLMSHLMKHGVRTILFCKYRKVCELVMKSLRITLASAGRLDILDRVKSYRGGYSIEDRRQVEREAFNGKLLGIVATNALELGVDIGALDAVIMLGFPFNVASLRQQSGRAGRRSRDSLSVLLAECLPVDQYYVQHPEEIFDKEPDGLVIDLDNKITLEAHLQCAANEMPISLSDSVYFGDNLEEVCKARLTTDGDGWYHTYTKFLPYPSKYISLRGVEDDKYIIIDVSGGRNRIIEEMEVSRVLFEIYEGGVFLHQGQTYIVKSVRHSAKQATLVQSDVNWITSPRDYTDINATQTHRIREIKGSPVRAYYGLVEVSVHVFGFFKIRGFKILDVVDMDNDPWEQETNGMWIDVPRDALDLLRDKNIKPAAAIHAAEHAFLNRFALAQDVRTECKAEEKEKIKKEESRRKRPARLIFCDFANRGGSAAAKAFDHVHDLLAKAHRAVESCDCVDVRGCGRCVQSHLCKEKNKVASRMGALIVLKAILALPINPDDIPYQEDEIDDAGHDTIVSASKVRALGDVPVETEEINSDSTYVT